MDISTVKGIRYTYQIDYMNAEPTHLKSQVHRLPVVSEPQATALDTFQKQVDSYVPQRDTAVTYSAPTDSVLSSPIARASDNAIVNSLSNSTQPATEGVLRGSSDVLKPNGINSNLPEGEVVLAQPVTEPNQIKLDIRNDELRPLEGVKPTLQTELQNVRNGIATEQNPIFQGTRFKVPEYNGVQSDNIIPQQGTGLETNVLSEGSQLNDNANENAINSLDVASVDKIDSQKPVPSYLIPGPDEIDEPEILPKNFNRYLSNQAQTLYGYISGAVSQMTSGSFSVLA